MRLIIAYIFIIIGFNSIAQINKHPERLTIKYENLECEDELDTRSIYAQEHLPLLKFFDRDRDFVRRKEFDN
jgi:hypothetical protein